MSPIRKNAIIPLLCGPNAKNFIYLCTGFNTNLAVRGTDSRSGSFLKSCIY